MTFNKKEKHYPGQSIFLKDGIEVGPAMFIYDNIIENPQEIIDFSLRNPDSWRESMVGGGTNESVVNKKTRSTRILDIPASFSNDIKWFEISQIIWSYANRYGEENDAPFSNMESPQLLHYSIQGGFYKTHIDSVPGHPRIFSSILYLNDVEEGGETYFNRFNITINPKAGRLVMFPANYVYSHEAKTPKSNDKFAIVTWFNPII